MLEIKNPPIKLSAGLLEGYIPVEALNTAIKEALVKVMFEKICPGDKCLLPDEAYFVGLAPQTDDFAAPKGISESYTPNVREIVHFDSVDFEAMNLSQSKLYATKDTMLNYGYEMPEIWKTLLTEKGFVDRDVDIIDHLKGDSGGEMGREGVYPCNYSTYTVDKCGRLTLHKQGDYSKCRHIKKLKVTKLFGNYKIKMELKDGGEIEVNQDWDPATKSVELKCGNSELKYFVNFNRNSPDGLKFSERLNKTLIYLNNLDDKYKKGEKADADGRLYTKNQIGDYLGFVEYEEEYQKTLDQLGLKVDESRASLIEELAKFGYTPKEDFDLAKDADYEEVKKVINDAKDDLVKVTCGAIKSINSKNEVLQEQLTKLRGVCAALEQDKDEMVSLTDNMSGGDELEEKIKTEKTDREAQAKHDAEVEKSHQDKLADFPIPYYAAY